MPWEKVYLQPLISNGAVPRYFGGKKKARKSQRVRGFTPRILLCCFSNSCSFVTEFSTFSIYFKDRDPPGDPQEKMGRRNGLDMFPKYLVFVQAWIKSYYCHYCIPSWAVKTTRPVRFGNTRKLIDGWHLFPSPILSRKIICQTSIPWCSISPGCISELASEMKDQWRSPTICQLMARLDSRPE